LIVFRVNSLSISNFYAILIFSIASLGSKQPCTKQKGPFHRQ